MLPARERSWRRFARLARGGSGLALAFAVGFGVFGLAATVHAAGADRATSCPTAADTPVPHDPTALDALDDDLAQQHQRCVEVAGFLALRGAVALKRGQPAIAGEWLERAIMLDPDQAGAVLDYALARRDLGDLDSARTLLEQVLIDYHPPPAIAALVRRELADLERFRLARLAALFTTTRASLAVSMLRQYDSNLNVAPSRGSVELSFPEGTVVLPLDPAFRPRAGAAWLLDVAGEVRQPIGRDAVAFGQGLLRQRVVDADSGYDSLRAELAGGFAWRTAAGQGLAVAGLQSIRLGSATLRESVRGLAGHYWPLPHRDCGVQGLAEVERIHYPVVTDLDGTLLALGAVLLCESNDGWSWRLQTRIGRDRPTNGRAGGAQTLLELRLAATLARGDHRLELEAGVAAQRDADPYSALLDAGSRRSVDRFAARAEWRWGFAPRWQLVAGLELFEQRSNLTLFETRGRVISLGVRWALQ